jgi:hypothetical protein
VPVEDDDLSEWPDTNKATDKSVAEQQEILTGNLNKRRIEAKFVLWLLANDHKQRHVNVCLEL